MLRIVVLTVFAVALTSGGIIRPNPKVKGFKLLHQVPYTAVGECPQKPEGNNPTFLPDSDNCQLYYECSNGEAVQNHCPDNLQWNTVLNTCDFPENVNCDKGESKKAEIVHPLTAVGECPQKQEGGFPTFLPDSDNCQIYYECSNGEAVQNHCPDDLQWNTVLNVCDFPVNVNCDKGESKKAKIAHPLTAVGECPQKQEGGFPTFLPDSDNCQIYYECSNGEAIKNNCPGNLQWNTALNTCDFPEKVNCDKGESKKAKIAHLLTAVGECPQKQEGGFPTFLPDSDNCQIYYECSNGEAIQNNCPGDLQWNTVLNTCDFPENVNCDKGESKKLQTIRPYKPVGECPVPQGTLPVYLPDSDDCTIFYECDAAGVPVPKECMPGLEFNPVTHVCEFPNTANCKAGSKPLKIIPLIMKQRS